MPEELRDRIHVLCIAPSVYIDRNLCGSVLHLVADNDLVPKIDSAGRKRNQHTIQHVGSSKDGRLADHSMQSPLYTKPIQDWFIDRKKDLNL